MVRLEPIQSLLNCSNTAFSLLVGDRLSVERYQMGSIEIILDESFQGF
ncbi:MAG: hypothetical protein F6K18_27970 [Okeania sp. SIO2C2]|nr:hypothetical protein [Okeania sp. SIO2C2]NEP90355.1 hypothetical protein [Okeania sp. SIO2C2]